MASISFGRLEDRVWSDGDLTIKTKMTVYETCVLTALLYALETLTIFQPQMKVLERFHQTVQAYFASKMAESRT